ncbi:MAG: hypothetical protein WAV31_00970 [Candidatus Moraniibacteriota bacterium]
MDKDDPRFKKWETIFKWGLGFGGAIAISQVALLAIQGILGLVVAIGLGETIIQLAPVFSLKLANWKIKLLTAEVEANPIETLIGLKIEKDREYGQAGQDIVAFETEVRNFHDEVATFEGQFPEEAAAYRDIYKKMSSGLDDMKKRQAEAATKLDALSKTIEKAKAIYKMSLAAERVTQLSKPAEAIVFADIKERIAFDTVRTQLNHSFASLNNAVNLRREIRPKAFPLGGEKTAGLIESKEAV